MKKQKNQHGITLITRVVTIIVLLILAGVSLSLIAGGNGIIGKAEKALIETQKSALKEETELALAELQMEHCRQALKKRNRWNYRVYDAGRGCDFVCGLVNQFLFNNIQRKRRSGCDSKSIGEL